MPVEFMKPCKRWARYIEFNRFCCKRQKIELRATNYLYEQLTLQIYQVICQHKLHGMILRLSIRSSAPWDDTTPFHTVIRSMGWYYAYLYNHQLHEMILRLSIQSSAPWDDTTPFHTIISCMEWDYAFTYDHQLLGMILCLSIRASAPWNDIMVLWDDTTPIYIIISSMGWYYSFP
jgi:hypothetical protein